MSDNRPQRANIRNEDPTAKASTLKTSMRVGFIQNLHSFAADLTQNRVRGHAVLLGLILWGAYAFNVATPGLIDRQGQLKGADFLHVYVLGNIARMHDASLLYDAHRQASLAVSLIHCDPRESYLPIYGPQYSLLFLPLAALPYGWAAASWMLCSALIYFVCCWCVLRACPGLRADRKTVLIVAAACPAFFFLVASGQNSALALIAFTAAFFCFRARLPFLAGMAIGLAAYKPQFGLMAALVFVITLEWKVVLGALITSIGQLAVGALYYGKAVLTAYEQSLTHINQSANALEPHLDRMHSLRSFWQMLLPWQGVATGLYAVSALLVVALTVSIWKSKAPVELRYTLFLLGTALVDPHLTDYDLVILVPAFMVIGDRILLSDSKQRDSARLLTYAAFFLPLFGPMLKGFHLQLSVPVYAGLFIVVASFVRHSLHNSADPAKMQAAIASSTTP